MLASALPAALLAAAADPIVVAVSPFPPHVMQAGSEFEGFDVDIWNAVTREIGSDSAFRLEPFEDLIEAVKTGEVDAAVGGISITRERELLMDFSHPYIDSGLRILTTFEESGGLLRVLLAIATETELGALGYVLAFMVLCAHLLYFVERGSSAISRRYFPGILEAAWCVLATITTVGYGDVTPKRWFGRLVSLIVMVIGISLFGLAVAQLSAGLMLEGLKGAVEGPGDLRGRRVATVAGTTSTLVAARFGPRLREVESMEEACALLEAGQVEAVLYDAAPLMHYAQHSAGNKLTVVGPLIEKQFYGIAFPQGSALRESVNRALMGLQESGEYDRIYAKWFGASN